MSDYMLPTGHVRHAATEPYGTRITGPEFDTWLASVKAEAWDEGFATAETSHLLPDNSGVTFANPYREQEER